MSHINKPVDWEVFSIPPIQPVQYYSILKKQREFSQLIRQYDAQVFRHGYLHFCGIVPKYLSSPLSSRHEIFIVFLDETPTTSFIGFRVKVSKEAFIYERKSLLLFLKNSEKATFYSMSYNRIHVQCGKNPWELFYLLYDDYLRKYVLTIIGTQFFYNFIYSYYIEKEKQFLKLLYKGSKVIRVCRSSIYYKIHRKRKISVTDLVHMTLNMPKRKKYIISHFNAKEPFYSDYSHHDLYTPDGNKVDVSKLMLKMYKKQDIVLEKPSQKSVFTDVTHKRKFDEIDNNQYLQADTSSKHLKTAKSYSSDIQWDQFQKFKSYSVKNYSDISFIKPFVPNLLKNGNSSLDSNLHSVGVHSNNCLPLLQSSDNQKDEIKDSTIVQATNYSDSTKSCDINATHFPSNIDVNNDFVPEDVDFTTAAGKVINISSEAMLKAYNLCEKEQIVFEKKCSNTVKYEVQNKVIKTDSKQESLTKDINLPKASGFKYLQGFSFLKKNEKMPKTPVRSSSTISENLKLDDFDVSEDVTFSTAAGKIINISNSAVEAAEKLIYNTTDVQKRSLHSESSSIQRNQFSNYGISNNGCTSRTDDVDMDNTLVDKFFEDVQFDEKEIELAENNIKKDNAGANDSKKDLPSRKPKKSLGGRRSMRYCSDKL